MKASFRDQGIATVDRLQPGRRATRLLAGRGQAAARGRAPGAIEAAEPEDDPVAGRRPLHRRLARGREDRAERPRHDLDRQAGEPATAATATPATSSTQERDLLRHDRPEPLQLRQAARRERPASPAAKAVVEYTWGKLWNAKAYNACSNMPRFGHAGILTEQQIKRRDGAAARSRIAGQPVDRCAGPQGGWLAGRPDGPARSGSDDRGASSCGPRLRLGRRHGAGTSPTPTPRTASSALRPAALRQRLAAAHDRLPRAAAAGALPRAQRQPRRRRDARAQRRTSSASTC